MIGGKDFRLTLDTYIEASTLKCVPSKRRMAEDENIALWTTVVVSSTGNLKDLAPIFLEDGT